MLLDYIFGSVSTGVISIFLFGEYPIPTEECEEE